MFVDRELSSRVIETLTREGCTDLLAAFVLARFGGLRSPNETTRLRWSDVDFAADRITIPSNTKTGSRVLPLFPEIRETLEPLPRVGERVLAGYAVDANSKHNSVGFSTATGSLRARERGSVVESGSRCQPR